MGVLAAAVLPNLPGFLNAATGRALFPAVFNDLYSYAWFIGLGLALVLYYPLMRSRVRPAA